MVWDKPNEQLASCFSSRRGLGRSFETPVHDSIDSMRIAIGLLDRSVRPLVYTCQEVESWSVAIWLKLFGACVGAKTAVYRSNGFIDGG